MGRPRLRSNINICFIPKTKKIVLDASLLNTQNYKVRIEGKWSNPGKWVVPFPTHWSSKLSKREPSGHPRLWSPTLLTYIYIYRERERAREREREREMSLPLVQILNGTFCVSLRINSLEKDMDLFYSQHRVNSETVVCLEFVRQLIWNENSWAVKISPCAIFYPWYRGWINYFLFVNSLSLSMYIYIYIYIYMTLFVFLMKTFETIRYQINPRTWDLNCF